MLPEEGRSGRGGLRPHVAGEEFAWVLAGRVVVVMGAGSYGYGGDGGLELGKEGGEVRGGRCGEVVAGVGLRGEGGVDVVALCAVEEGGDAGEGTEGVEEG